MLKNQRLQAQEGFFLSKNKALFAGELLSGKRGRISLQHRVSDKGGYFIQQKPGRSERMKILMLSWEFPPRVVGGIAPHVHDLSLSLQEQGQEVLVLTIGTPESAEEQGWGRGLTFTGLNPVIPILRILSLGPYSLTSIWWKKRSS